MYIYLVYIVASKNQGTFISLFNMKKENYKYWLAVDLDQALVFRILIVQVFFFECYF